MVSKSKESINKNTGYDLPEKFKTITSEVDRISKSVSAVIYVKDNANDPHQLFIEDINYLGNHTDLDTIKVFDVVHTFATLLNLLLSKRVLPGYSKVDRNNCIVKAISEIHMMEMELNQGKKRTRKLI